MLSFKSIREMKKTSVLFIIDSLTCGGAEKSLVSLLPLLNKDKYDVYLWMRSPGGAFMPLIPKNVHIVEQPSYNVIENLKMLLGKLYFSIMLRINKLFGKAEHGAETLWKCQGWAMKVPEGKWDVVVAYQQGLPTYLVADKFSGCKKLAWVNVNVFKAGYKTEFNNKFYEKMDYIVPVSALLHKLILEKIPQFKEKYHLVYDILNPQVIKDLGDEHVQNLKNEQDEWIFVTTGRLVPQKGHDIAISAAEELKHKGVKFKWFFIGEGGERRNIERMIKEKGLQKCVILLGMHTNPYAFMRQADVYVQTSKFEGFGLTISEAKILGKPVVSTNFEVVYNQLTHEKNGLIAEMNGKSVADNIYRMITDDELREAIIAEIKNEHNTTYFTEVKKVEEMFDA